MDKKSKLEEIKDYDYVSICSRNTEELDKKVTKLLNEGYRLYGYPYSISSFLIQTLVRTPMKKIEGEEDE